MGDGLGRVGSVREVPAGPCLYGLCPDGVSMSVQDRGNVGGHHPYALAAGALGHLKGITDVSVALTAVDALELAWYLPTECVGVGVGHPCPMLYREIKLAHQVDPAGLLPDEVMK